MKILNEPLHAELAFMHKNIDTHKKYLHKVQDEVIDLQKEFNQPLEIDLLKEINKAAAPQTEPPK